MDVAAARTQEVNSHWSLSVTHPGVYERTMTANELVFNPVLDWSVWTSIRLAPTGPISDSQEFAKRVRQAWKRILHEQPQLASTFNHSSGIVTYTPLSASSLELWLDSTLIASQSEKEDLYTCAVPHDKPILCINPSTKEILFRVPHSYTDGMGAVSLLADLVEYITSSCDPAPASSDVINNLAPIFSVAAGVRAPHPQDIALSTQLSASYFEAPESIGLPFLSGPPIQHHISELRLSIEDSKKVLKACKENSWTVTHAVHAALIQATAELDLNSKPEVGENAQEREREAKCYAAMTPYNWRSKLQPSFQRCRAAIYCGTFPTIVSSPITKPFSVLASKLKSIYTSTANNEELVRAYDSWVVALLEGMMTAQPHTRCTPGLSSLGIIENGLPRVVNGVEVENFRLGLDMKGPFVHVFSWSWGGRLSVCAVSDRGTFGEGVIDGLLELIGQKLAAGLDVGIEQQIKQERT